MMTTKVTGIILLAGNSTRYGKNFNKNFEKINDKYVISYSIDVFNHNKNINDIILVIREYDLKIIREIVANVNWQKSVNLVIGGSTRGESVYNALLETDSDIVLIHDGARPLIRDEYINNCLDNLLSYSGVVIGTKAKDTIKITNELGEVIQSTNRVNTWMAGTPQAFNRKLLLMLYNKYKNKEFTDDASILEMDGYKVKMVEGDCTNIKITTKEDIEIAKQYIKKFKN